MKFWKKGEYRVLALALVFFGTGLFFWLSSKPAPPAAAPQTPAPGASVASQADMQENISPSPFANMPSPSSFRTFIVSGGTIGGAPSIAVTSTCADAYVTVLAFPSSVDYREDVGRAVYNSAFPCTASGTVVTATIAVSDLGNAASGTYYYFTADQGTSGTWYNPR